MVIMFVVFGRGGANFTLLVEGANGCGTFASGYAGLFCGHISVYAIVFNFVFNVNWGTDLYGVKRGVINR